MMDFAVPAPQSLVARALAKRRARAVGTLLGTSLLLLSAVLLSASNGALPISPRDTWAAIVAGLRGHAGALEGTGAIVWNLRLPRVLMAVLVGASLGTSGGAMQGLFRNPLADPFLLGAASGAAFGATVAVTWGGQLSATFTDVPFAPGSVSGFVPLFSFLGALGAVSVTVVLARAGGRSRTTALLLAGVVVGAVLVSLTCYLWLRDQDRMRAVFSWTQGNLALSKWSDLGRALPYAAVGVGILFALARGLDALQLGEDTARTLGMNVPLLRFGVIVGASLATASAVAFVGMIGFVGLVAPHVMRRIGTPNHRVLLPASALAGATLLVVADVGARTLIRPAELPVGIVTSVVGGPLFLWLLWRER
ncbi:MAG: iron ABC transporter permease [Myxococcota bacterium]|nr:iron ABC transporter permease [Myxococcota bacterium]